MSVEEFTNVQSNTKPEIRSIGAAIAVKVSKEEDESSCPTLYDKAMAKQKIKEEEAARFSFDDDSGPILYDKTAAKEKLKSEVKRKAAEEKAEAERKAADEKAKLEREATEEKAKAEREAAEEKAKAEREAAEKKAKAEREAAEKIAKEEEEKRKEKIRQIAEKTAKERLQDSLMLVKKAQSLQHKLEAQFARQFTVAKVKATPKEQWRDPNDKSEKVYVPPPIRAKMKVVDDFGLARGHSGEYGDDECDDSEENDEIVEISRDDETSSEGEPVKKHEKNARIIRSRVHKEEVREDVEDVDHLLSTRPGLEPEPVKSGILKAWDEVKEIAADIQYTFSEHPEEDSTVSTIQSKSQNGRIKKKRSKRKKSKRNKLKRNESKEQLYEL